MKANLWEERKKRKERKPLQAVLISFNTARARPGPSVAGLTMCLLRTPCPPLPPKWGWEPRMRCTQTGRCFCLLSHLGLRASCQGIAASGEHCLNGVSMWGRRGRGTGRKAQFSPLESPSPLIRPQDHLEVSTCPEKGNRLHLMILGGEFTRGLL